MIVANFLNLYIIFLLLLFYFNKGRWYHSTESQDHRDWKRPQEIIEYNSPAKAATLQ